MHIPFSPLKCYNETIKNVLGTQRKGGILLMAKVHIESVCYNDFPVCLIWTHAGLSSGYGPTHNTIIEFGIMNAMPNMTMVAPCDANQAKRLLRWIRLSRRTVSILWIGCRWNREDGVGVFEVIEIVIWKTRLNKLRSTEFSISIFFTHFTQNHKIIIKSLVF